MQGKSYQPVKRKKVKAKAKVLTALISASAIRKQANSKVKDMQLIMHVLLDYI